MAKPESETASAMRTIAARFAHRIARIQRPWLASGVASSAAAAAATKLRFDPNRGLVVRVLHGLDEGREFVLTRAALAALPNAPAGAIANPKSVLPGGVSMRVGSDGGPTVVVRWEDGAESAMSLEELKRLSA